MALIQWNDRLSVGVVEIDLQHQKLVEMINKLDDAMQLGKGKDVLGEIINGLIEYSKTHFRTEEDYFDRFGYPNALCHKKEHAEFTTKVAEFKKAFDAKTLALSIGVMYFLSNWLKNHIKNSDKQFGLFFNENGLK